MAKFPEPEWLQALMDKLNRDEQYARVARNWEGDFYFVIEPDDALPEQIIFYFDLWHGKCNDGFVVDDVGVKDPAFVLNAPYKNYKLILLGELHPMQALMTRRLRVKGNMAVLVRNVPTVLDFVRCAREVTDSFAA
ncbi:MAG: SCP2 sterol-binding domain-containing protein [Anaerolineales bacterium]|jgi:putative sterol carrier protein